MDDYQDKIFGEFESTFESERVMSTLADDANSNVRSGLRRKKSEGST